MIISNAALKNRTTVVVLIVLIVVAGAYSYITLPRESSPDVKIPYIIVSTVYTDVSPVDVKTQITNKIENELVGLKDVKEITSASAKGESSIVIEFHPNVDIEDALQRVKDKVDIAKAELTNDERREEPTVREINVAEFPIMMINISGKVSPVALKKVAEKLEDRLKGVPGVLDVDVLGALEHEIRIEFDPDRLSAYALTVDEVLSLIPTSNLNISAGVIETSGRKFSIRVPAEFEEPERINKLMVATRNGKPIYLTDVARVRDTFKDRTSYARLDGVESITVAVKKRIGANIVHIARYVKAILAEARKEAQATVKFEMTLDQSRDIDMMVKDLENNILTGLVLVVAVLVIFMGLRSSLIVALAIPMSMLISFALLQALGYTLNMIVLFSLILALGMLVDNAIVIVENIYRYRTMGYNKLDSAMKGTAEVAWPVITSTATTVAAFAPLLAWPGIMGDFMKYLPITVIITLTSSLFVAMVISPVVASVFSGSGQNRRTEESRFVRAYRSLLRTALSHRLATICMAVLLLAGILVVFAKYNAGVQLFPEFDPRYAIVNLRGPQGMNIHDVNAITADVEKKVDNYRVDPKGAKIIEHVVTNVGSGGGFSLVGGSSGPHVSNLTMKFVDYEDRRTPSAKTIKRIRKAPNDVPEMKVKIEKDEEGPPTGAPVTVRIIGKDKDPKELAKISKQAWELIKDVPNMVNLDSNLEAACPELRFKCDRERAKSLGLNVLVIGNFVRMSISGAKVGTFRVFNDEYDITIRLPESQRVNIDDLMRLRVMNNLGRPVPLSSLGQFSYSPGLGTIHRIDRKDVVTLTADVEGRLGEDVLKDVQERLKKLELPAGYEIRYAGEKETQDESQEFLLRAFAIAILIIVGILVTQFNTLSAPLIIMTTVLLSTAGVFCGLLIFDMPFGVVMTGVGVISLAGVVVNNAIVLLDYTRRLQRRGMDVIAAAVQAGATRLRPVLLTAATTILGLLPMATGVSFNFHKMTLATRSESSQWWASMAIAVIFGLAFATVMTLVIVPSLYVSLYRLAARMGLGGLRHAGELPPKEQAQRGIEMEDF